MGNQNFLKNEKLLNEILSNKEANKKLKEFLDEDKISYNYITELRRINVRNGNGNQHFNEKSQMNLITSSKAVVECSLEAFSILITAGINHNVNSTLYNATTIPKLYDGINQINSASNIDFLENQCALVVDWVEKVYLKSEEFKFKNWEPDAKINRVTRDQRNNSLSKIEFSSIAKDDDADYSELSVNKEELILEKESKHSRSVIVNKKAKRIISKSSNKKNKIKNSNAGSRSVSKNSVSEDEVAAGKKLNSLKINSTSKKKENKTLGNLTPGNNYNSNNTNLNENKKNTLEADNNLQTYASKNTMANNVNLNSSKINKEKTEFDAKTVNSILNIMNKVNSNSKEDNIRKDKFSAEKTKEFNNEKAISGNYESNKKIIINDNDKKLKTINSPKLSANYSRKNSKSKSKDEFKSNKIFGTNNDIKLAKKKIEGQAAIPLTKSKNKLDNLAVRNKILKDEKIKYSTYSKEKSNIFKQPKKNPETEKESKEINNKNSNHYKTHTYYNYETLYSKSPHKRKKYSEVDNRSKDSKFKSRSNSNLRLKNKFNSENREGEEIENEQLKDFADFIMENLFGMNVKNKNDENTNFNDISHVKIVSKKQNINRVGNTKFKKTTSINKNNLNRQNKRLRIDLRTLDSDYECDREEEKEKEKFGTFLAKSINRSPSKEIKILIQNNNFNLNQNVNGLTNSTHDKNFGYNTAGNSKRLSQDVEKMLSFNKLKSNGPFKNKTDLKSNLILNHSENLVTNLINSQDNNGLKTSTPLLNKISQSVFSSNMVDIPKIKKFDSSNSVKNIIGIGSNKNLKIINSNTNFKLNQEDVQDNVENKKQISNFANLNDYKEILNNFDLTPLDSKLPYLDRLKMLKDNNKFLFEITSEEMKINEKLKSLGIMYNKKIEDKKE